MLIESLTILARSTDWNSALANAALRLKVNATALADAVRKLRNRQLPEKFLVQAALEEATSIRLHLIDAYWPSPHKMSADDTELVECALLIVLLAKAEHHWFVAGWCEHIAFLSIITEGDLAVLKRWLPALEALADELPPIDRPLLLFTQGLWLMLAGAAMTGSSLSSLAALAESQHTTILGQFEGVRDADLIEIKMEQAIEVLKTV